MMMPAVIFCVLAASLYGCLYHFFRGGNLFSLIVYIIVSNAGFFLGQYIGELLGAGFFELGTINFGVGSIFSWLLLGISGWINRPIE